MIQNYSAKISIIATVRNEKQTIEKFLRSLLEQTRRADEIIIVDGASTDGTREILEKYAAQGLLRVISKPCNIAQGRNLGIAAATGTHIAVTDAGCQVDSNWLAEIAQCFSASPAPDVVAGNFRFETHSLFEDAVVCATFQPNRDETEAARYYPSSRSVAFTKAAWEKAGGYPEWLYAAEDTLFNMRMRQLGYHFVFCRDAIVRWRPRETWRALARQRVNFSRGNARVGIGTAGYLINLRIHGLMAALLVMALWFPAFLIAAIALSIWHVHKHLWPQMISSTPSQDWRIRLRVIAVMEFVRIINLYGFMLGRWDRLSDPSYISRQVEYMGVTSADDIDFVASPAKNRNHKKRLFSDSPIHFIIAPLTILSGLVAVFTGSAYWANTMPVFVVAVFGTVILLAKSLLDFSRTGPGLQEEILTHYRRYILFALARLTLWAFAIMLFTGGGGVLTYYMLNISMGGTWAMGPAMLAAALGILAATLLQFIRKLRFNPGLLVASMHYRMSRFYWLWRWATPIRIYCVQYTWGGITTLLFITASLQLVQLNHTTELISLWAALLFYVGTIACAAWLPEAQPPARIPERFADTPPNILMIGSDTLRADRLGTLGYRRTLTPHIDTLAAQGVLFSNCYVPCARTAPSLISLMTGTWPHTHGIRDNFAADKETRLKVDTLPNLLKAQGYNTAAISDWCGGDMGKFSFGFDETDLPEDQWNLKYLIRQGPKDLRLFVSLFTHNLLGRWLLPEIYYLGGVPLTQPMGRRARQLVSRLAESTQPFFINIFYSTTHPPFASAWPWYTRFVDPAYMGESKFAMARLTDPFEIIRRQGAPKEEFDLDQIIDLYDGCVAEFDDQVGKMLHHLEACGLASNTIVVVYSDHGMEFFEHGTWGQGNSVLGDHSAHIPLIIADPRQPPGGVVSHITRSIDVAPTLLQLIDIEPPLTMDGTSLLPYMSGKAVDYDLAAFNETGIWLTDLPGTPKNHLRYPDLIELLEIPDKHMGTLAIKPEYENIVVQAKDRMIRTKQWKLVYQAMHEENLYSLFDIINDPECHQDVALQHPEIFLALKKRLLCWMEPTNQEISEACHFERQK